MAVQVLSLGIELFSTCPPSSRHNGKGYSQKVSDIARWSERQGCRGILVYSDNSQYDPWLVSQVIVENTDMLCPLVAVQPAYMHPYAVAKMLSSFAALYSRRLYLNMVAGGFKNDLLALNDTTPHDGRYTRLVEYTTIIQRLLSSREPVSFEGAYYKVNLLKLTPPLPAALAPGVFLSGSSEAGIAAARELGATAIKYPRPAHECEKDPPPAGVAAGVRVGVIARDDEAESWRVARERFPEDRRGQLTHQLAMKTSDSVWHHQLSQQSARAAEESSPYWMHPFNNYQTFCPYLVGSYPRVAAELARYIALGYRTFILDVPPDEEELRHTNVAFALAASEVPLWREFSKTL